MRSVGLWGTYQILEMGEPMSGRSHELGRQEKGAGEDKSACSSLDIPS